MHFYSTNNRQLKVTLQQAVTQGLAPDNGLYMPEYINKLSPRFLEALPTLSFQEIALEVALVLLGTEDIPKADMERIVEHTIQFDAPVVDIEPDTYSLELFHGPTLAFKDFGARFMSQVLGYFAQQQDREIVVLVATSGDTGSAVANGFLNVPGTRVIVLYPAGKVSDLQEKQFTTLGGNITALEVDGTFDDCQRLVKQAFLDEALRTRYFLTSANSINIARLIPQTFYYFHAYKQLQAGGNRKPLVFSVPSGNFGNLTGGLLAKRMGLPVDHFIAATNINDVVPEYLLTSRFTPRSSRQTLSNAMDVGNPSNFVRMLDLYDHAYDKLKREITGYSFTDEETRKVMQQVRKTSGYTLDPHGAIGYLGWKKYREANGDAFAGVFLETAHPAKFKSVVDETLQEETPIPEPLARFIHQRKTSIAMSSVYDEFRGFLTDTLT